MNPVVVNDDRTMTEILYDITMNVDKTVTIDDMTLTEILDARTVPQNLDDMTRTEVTNDEKYKFDSNVVCLDST